MTINLAGPAKAGATTYSLVFASRPPTPLGTGTAKSRFGHAFVVWRRQQFLDEGTTTIEAAIGWEADNAMAAAASSLASGSMPFGPGHLRDDADSLTFAKRLLTVSVTREQFQRTLAQARVFARDRSYILGERDCVDFVAERAADLGLKLPKRALGNALPDDYVRDLIELNRPGRPQHPLPDANRLNAADADALLRILAEAETASENWIDIFFDVDGTQVRLAGTRTQPALPGRSDRRGGGACARFRQSSPDSVQPGKVLQSELAGLSEKDLGNRAAPTPLSALASFWIAADAPEDLCLSSWLKEPLAASTFEANLYPDTVLLVRTDQPEGVGAPRSVSRATSLPIDWAKASEVGISALVFDHVHEAESALRRHHNQAVSQRRLSSPETQALVAASIANAAIHRDLHERWRQRADAIEHRRAAFDQMIALQAGELERAKETNSVWNISIQAISLAAAAKAEVAISSALGSIAAPGPGPAISRILSGGGLPAQAAERLAGVADGRQGAVDTGLDDHGLVAPRSVGTHVCAEGGWCVLGRRA
ncbi:MAG TPA: hypothetical protein VHG32_25530, partial [Thermoanaerobaculia bacterium]|nr:hypothetical protein [Thermoanaerobaculia bacterium]